MKRKTFVLTLSLMFAVIGASAQTTTTTYRDEYGRRTGTATTDRNGTTTFRDEYGRRTGTATTDRNGTTTYRDEYGRRTGTSKTQ